MKNYRSISFNGQVLPITQISFLRRQIRKRKCKEGKYVCITPSGTTHTITFETQVKSSSGYGSKPTCKSKKKRAASNVYNVLQKSIVISKPRINEIS